MSQVRFKIKICNPYWRQLPNDLAIKEASKFYKNSELLL